MSMVMSKLLRSLIACTGWGQDKNGDMAGKSGYQGIFVLWFSASGEGS